MQPTVMPVEQPKYVNVLGVLSIIFGSLGVLFGVLFAVASLIPTEAQPNIDPLPAVVTVIFWIAPHVFFIIAGAKVMKYPAPGQAKGLVITTLVLGALYNLILLGFAIAVLAQFGDYERYIASKKQPEDLPPTQI